MEDSATRPSLDRVDMSSQRGSVGRCVKLVFDPPDDLLNNSFHKILMVKKLAVTTDFTIDFTPLTP